MENLHKRRIADMRKSVILVVDMGRASHRLGFLIIILLALLGLVVVLIAGNQNTNDTPQPDYQFQVANVVLKNSGGLCP